MLNLVIFVFSCECVYLIFKAYVTSTQYTNWHFSPPELVTLRTDCNVEALKRFVSSSDQCESDQIPQLHMEQELNIVKRYVFLMRVLFDKFKNPQLPDEVRFVYCCIDDYTWFLS